MVQRYQGHQTSVGLQKEATSRRSRRSRSWTHHRYEGGGASVDVRTFRIWLLTHSEFNSQLCWLPKCRGNKNKTKKNHFHESSRLLLDYWKVTYPVHFFSASQTLVVGGVCPEAPEWPKQTFWSRGRTRTPKDVYSNEHKCEGVLTERKRTTNDKGKSRLGCVHGSVSLLFHMIYEWDYCEL